MRVVWISLSMIALVACTDSASSLHGSPRELCTQTFNKRAACDGGDGTCLITLDGGVECADMAGVTPSGDPTKIEICTNGSSAWNPDYWNAFFECYLDGKTASCEDDYKACQSVAVAKTQRSQTATDFLNACSSSKCTTFNPDLCPASILFNDATLKQGLSCFDLACDQIKGCLSAAGLQ